MNKRQKKVFNLLRTKTKALGLNRKELESLAQKIDKNLQLEEDAWFKSHIYSNPKTSRRRRKPMLRY